MESKKTIIKLLELLKDQGYGRREIEVVLGYSPKSLDQNASRGGNQKVLASLRLLLKYAILEKSNSLVADSTHARSYLNGIQSNLDALKEILLDAPQTAGLSTEPEADEVVQGDDTVRKARRGGKPDK